MPIPACPLPHFNFAGLCLRQKSAPMAKAASHAPHMTKADEYRKPRDTPRLQQLNRWIVKGEVVAEIEGEMYFARASASITGELTPI